MTEVKYIPSAREKERAAPPTRRVYDIVADIKRLQAEQDRLLAKLVALTS